jgi:predicted aminopeptidase
MRDSSFASRIAARLALVILGLAVSGITLSGCQLDYLARAAYEEGRLLCNRRPISTELAREDLDPETRAKLETVGKVCAFAQQQLGMNVGNSYRTITTVDEGAIVWVVIAAPKDSLTPYTWWFPIVGAVPYRGYFDSADAHAEAVTFQKRGFDTLVRSSVAFSSLGFFDDPLLSNLLLLNRVQLAGVISHELFHRTFYAPSSAMFNESSANFVGNAAAVEFFAATEGPNSTDAATAREIVKSDLLFADFLQREEARLLTLYASKLPLEEIVRRRAPLLKQIQTDYAQLKPQLSGLERFDLDKEPLNNAVLIDYRLYFHDLDNFAALRRQYGGDLRKTIEAIIALAKAHPEDPFFAIWQATHPKS